MKLIVLLFISISILSIPSFAQSDIFNSKYIFNPMYFNPANTRIRPETELIYSISSGLRFVEELIPNKEILSISVPVKGQRWSIGLNAKHERSLLARNIEVKPSAAYHFSLNTTSRISVGISASCTKSEFEDLPMFPNGFNQSKINYNLGTGIFYEGKLGYLGFSITEIFRKEFSLIVNHESPPIFLLTENRKLAFRGGTSLRSNNRIFVLRPSFGLIKSVPAIYHTKDDLRYNVEMNVEIELYDIFNLGASYRDADILDDFSVEPTYLDVWFGYKDHDKKFILITNWNIQEPMFLDRFTIELLFGYRLDIKESLPMNYHFF